MLLLTLIQRVHNKIQWLKDFHWPRLVSRIQFLGLLFGHARPMEVTQKPTLIISPHQDDETLGCGGVIALKRDQNVSVHVAFVTDGAASHVWHPEFAQGEIAPVRQQESLEALQILGVPCENVHFLNQPDGQLKWIETDRQQQIVTQLTNLIHLTQPEEIYVTHAKDRSSDHEVTHGLVEQAIAASGRTVDLIQYPIWILWKPVLGQDLSLAELAGLRRLAIRGAIARKTQAIQAYRSQYLPIAETTSTVLPKGFLWRFRLPYELFLMPETKTP
jgi:N-acetylglucosamine malate deacetylase 1